jgi:hypothetical protein
VQRGDGNFFPGFCLLGSSCNCAEGEKRDGGSVQGAGMDANSEPAGGFLYARMSLSSHSHSFSG